MMRAPLVAFKLKKNNSCPIGGSCAEYNRVMQYGGPGITESMRLGLNIAGTNDVVLPPLSIGDRLIAVPRIQTQNFANMLDGNTNHLSGRYGNHDVGPYEAWKLGGKVKAAIRMDILKDRIRDIAVDNITVFTSKSLKEEASPAGDRKKSDVDMECDDYSDEHMDSATRDGLRAGRYSVEQLLRACHISVRGKGATSMKAHVVKCSVKKNSDRFKWKVSLVDVPTRVVCFILNILQLAHDLVALYYDEDSLDEKMKTFRRDHKEIMDQLGIKRSELEAALEHGKNVIFNNMDILTDLPVTQNSDALMHALEESGLSINFKSRCGKNCVKTLAYTVPTECTVRLKVYNKTVETLQQADARNNSISEKTAYLLEPSTLHMQERVVDENIIQHGYTRFETTIGVVDAENPKIPDFNKAVAEHRKLLERFITSQTMVSCSIQDTVEGMEEYVSRGIVVYHPRIGDAKAAAYGQVGASGASKKALKSTKKFLNAISEVSFVRYRNNDSGKMVGGQFHRSITGRQSGMERPAWRKAAEFLGWTMPTANNPLLFVAVMGDTVIPGQEQLANTYYRCVEVVRTGPELFTFLLPKFGGSAHRFTDWNRIGLDVMFLKCLRFQRLEAGTTPSYDTMGQMDIAIHGAQQDGGCAASSVASSDTLEAMMELSGFESRCYEISQHNGRLDNWVLWDTYSIRVGPKAGAERLRFKVGSDWFSLPKSEKYQSLIRLLKDNDPSSGNAIIRVRVDEKLGLQWQSEDGAMKLMGKCRKAQDIPVRPEPTPILGGSVEKTAHGDSMCICLETGNYFLPKSIRGKMEAYWQANAIFGSLDDRLRGLAVEHLEYKRGRVPSMSNDEEYLTIMDSNGVPIATNASNKRQRLQ